MQAGSQLRNPPVKFRQERWLHIWRSISIQHVQMEAGLNSDPGNDSFSDKIRDAKHVDRSTHFSTCRSTQVKSASTDLWPQEMFTFSEMLALVESESSFGAYVCQRRPGGSWATSDLVSKVNLKTPEQGFLVHRFYLSRKQKDCLWQGRFST